MSRIRKGSGCPVCGIATVAEHRPFCSRACKDRDLLKWLDGDYRIPGRAAAPTDQDNDES
jgi:uncharacterized protein